MNTSTYNRTRWLTLFGTIVTQFALGSVYTGACLTVRFLTNSAHRSAGRVLLWFAEPGSGDFIFRRGQAAGAFWREARDHGVRHPAGTGLFLTAHSSNLMMLWLSAGVLVGLADGAGYLLTLSNCVKWFPERKGLISAFAIGSYGLGSLGFKFIDAHLLASVGLEKPS